MKKVFCSFFAVLILLSGMIPAFAVDESRTYFFDLTVDGKTEKEVETGDIITVVLKLQRTDSDESYRMYAMQDEIRYDSKFFELVDGGALLTRGINSTDIALVDRHREFYLNYLSMIGGEQWDANTMIGSFQLKVIGETGVAKLTNEDFLVSLQDGSDSYACTAENITIMISEDCLVEFETDGGSEVSNQIVKLNKKVKQPKNPVKDGYTFAGWYADFDRTIPWNFGDDTVECNMTLYAKWLEGTVDVPGMSDGHGCCWCWLLLLLILLLILLYIKYRRDKAKRENRNVIGSEQE